MQKSKILAFLLALAVSIVLWYSVHLIPSSRLRLSTFCK